MPVWSLVHISGVQLHDFCKRCERNCSDEMREQIFDQVRTAAYHLIEKKGASYHAIGLATLTIVESIVRNQNTVLTVSSFLDNYFGVSYVCLSVPIILNRNGVMSKIELPLSNEEMRALEQSAEVIQSAMHHVGLI